MRTLFKSVFKASFLVFLGILLSELILRLPISGIGYDLPRAVDPVLNHRWLPNSRFTLYWYEALGVPAYERFTNSDSWFASYDMQKPKPPGIFRLFFVGDSYVEGISPQALSMPALVEKDLQSGTGQGGAALEIMNTGTFSYSPTIYYLLLKRKIIDFEPDLVVINVAMNDVFDDFVYSKSLSYDETGDIRGCSGAGDFANAYVRTTDYIRRKSRAEKFLSLFEDYSRIARVANVRLFDYMNAKVSAAPGMPLPNDWCREPWSSQTLEAVDYSMRMLRRSVSLLKQHNVKVALSAVPLREQLQGKFSLRPLLAVREAAQAEKVPYFDAFSALMKGIGTTSAEEFYIAGDMHLNARGNAVWAKAYAEFLRNPELNLLRPASR